MKLIANKLNNTYLRTILPSEGTEIDGVLAAIAYGSNIQGDLIQNCIDLKMRLDIWMRYDHTVPVAVPLLERLLKNHKNNIFCKLIPDCLHSKVIWWKGYGAYIGSSNLTERAWFTNIEAGLFIDDAELQASGMDLELENFFDQLQNLKEAFPLTKEVIEEMRKLVEIQKAKRKIDELAKQQRITPEWSGPTFINREKATDRNKEAFRKEWYETITTLRHIGDQLKENLPSWVKGDLPIEWVADQFLHSCYYEFYAEGNRKPYEEKYQQHKKNPQAALTEAINWWKNEPEPPCNEDETLYETAPFIQATLQEENILQITPEDLSQVCYYTHATKDHIIKMKLADLGRPDLKSLNREGRAPLYASWLLTQRNEKGWDIKQLLKYVLYEGKDEDIWERLFLAGKSPEYKIPHYGLNSLAEVAGWTRPNILPPRNGRTSKALRALGYNVKIH